MTVHLLTKNGPEFFSVFLLNILILEGSFSTFGRPLKISLLMVSVRRPRLIATSRKVHLLFRSPTPTAYKVAIPKSTLSDKTSTTELME
ncbi:hypothetical protein PsorP6_002116 [Peronosclerospora sorghi]|uniref:Uncharacterized protein n=1 Tax=Peronosclerospora sorghi TaxID=230839 RepID=A0ACC0WVM7_9STRA|nr:hypothetical protein PsorP6_002116 [Peronosclerospora sorghi]